MSVCSRHDWDSYPPDTIEPRHLARLLIWSSVVAALLCWVAFGGLR